MAPDSNRRIFIRDFRLKVSIGIHDFEHKTPQTVVVNADLLLGPAEKAHGGRIANVLDQRLLQIEVTASLRSLAAVTSICRRRWSTPSSTSAWRSRA